MNSYLLSVFNQDEELHQINQLLDTFGLPDINQNSQIDALIIKPELSIGINQIRKIKQFLSLKPYKYENKAVIIFSAHLMTLQAQNALLKTLEEPPQHSLIILSTTNKQMLLPTIISRCQEIKTGPQDTIINNHDYQKLFNFYNLLIKKRVGERLKLIEPYNKDRKEAIDLCSQLILILRNELKKSINQNNQSLLNQINQLRKAKIRLEANINVKLVMDNLVISLA